MERGRWSLGRRLGTGGRRERPRARGRRSHLSRGRSRAALDAPFAREGDGGRIGREPARRRCRYCGGWRSRFPKSMRSPTTSPILRNPLPAAPCDPVRLAMSSSPVPAKRASKSNITDFRGLRLQRFITQSFYGSCAGRAASIDQQRGHRRRQPSGPGRDLEAERFARRVRAPRARRPRGPHTG